MQKVRLDVIGVTYTQSQSGAYILFLQEAEGDRGLPITIGGLEAQAIAIAMEQVRPPRPLTHDLFKNFADFFEITVKEVFINKYQDGIFYSNLICVSKDKELVIDSRTSDAVALAVRFNCPVYTTEDIMSRVGDTKWSGNLKRRSRKREAEEKSDDLKAYTAEELDSMLQDSIDNEEFEKASQIRDEINRRKEENK